jgi:hypothetical protein
MDLCLGRPESCILGSSKDVLVRPQQCLSPYEQTFQCTASNGIASCPSSQLFKCGFRLPGLVVNDERQNIRQYF